MKRRELDRGAAEKFQKIWSWLRKCDNRGLAASEERECPRMWKRVKGRSRWQSKGFKGVDDRDAGRRTKKMGRNQRRRHTSPNEKVRLK